MNNMDMISIIVPVYNLEYYAESCIKSIAEQTYTNLEIIIVDDGSTDNSRLVLEKIAKGDQRIKLIFKENGGVTSARLEGVKQSLGSYIGFVDGDDYVEPEMYEKLYKNAITYSAQISHCGYQMVFPDGRKNYFYNTGVVEEHDSVTAQRELLSGKRIEPGLCNKLFNRELFKEILELKLIPENIKINEDLLMNYYLFRQADRSVYEDICPYHYVIRYDSASRQKMNHHKIFDPIEVKKIIYESASPEVKDEAFKAYQITCINVYNSIVIACDSTLKEDSTTIRKIICANDNYNLSLKYRCMEKMIQICPWVYGYFYRFYVRYIQKSKYH